MKQSILFTKTLKDAPKDETSLNAKTLIRAGFVDKVGAGIYSFLPLGMRVMAKILKIIREEINSTGGQEILMPALLPKEAWETTGRWENFDALFKLTGSDSREYALGATHEEAVTPLAKKFIFSYRELPFSVYQIQTKFRNEKRAKAGLLRGREFLMKDQYSFHVDQEDLDRFYEEVKAAYYRIYERLGLGEITYLTYASGGAFSKYSHEFQTLAEAGEDHIYLCDHCKIAVNREIIEEQNSCPICGNSELREEKAIEVGNIFKLGTRFSNPCNLKYATADGRNEEVVMGCYGIGPSRLLGTIVEVYHDEKGLKWPKEIAPFQVHLLSLKANQEAEEIYQKLIAQGVEVLYDDRDVSAGEKFADADLIGIPERIVVSAKTLAEDSVEIKNRDSEKIETIKIKDYVQRFF
ncbi:MAG: His/Gly/Thr/Pro-type tRNA ligase C-terminal domain-containing protein [Patescibacteria group bacterium]|nr:His/Gly/Thr/Pro-type tRNA ligase C-terminal domain-containing protein [Patescibacteria group bacterium]